MAKILVVDDNEQLSSMVKDVLESWGHQVFEAVEGRQSLELARRELPDIILLDVMLPGLSGYEVCGELKHDPLTENIAVIMVSALSEVDNRIHGYKVGADNFLVKPINYLELEAIVTKLLEQKRRLEDMESCEHVVTAIQKLIQVLGGFSVSQETFREEAEFCQKLLELLNWEEQLVRRCLLAISLRQILHLPAELKLSPAAERSLLNSLRLGSWFNPLYAYVKAAGGKTGPEQQALLLEAVKKQGLEAVADFVLLLDRFFQLERQGPDRDKVIKLLKVEAGDGRYNLKLLKSLEQLVNDEKVLAELQ